MEAASRVAVSVGNSTGGFVTVKPKNGATLGPGYVSLGGDDNAKPFYDGSGKITLQTVEYPGLSMSLRNRQVVGLEVTQASWPVPHDLRVGTAAARVRQVLGAPTMEGSGPEGVEGLSYCEKENCVQFLVHASTGTISQIRWSFYYD